MSKTPKTLKTPKTHHNVWSSRFSYIMATTGAAVGLGNIWMFPYVAGQNGGSAFVLLYLVLVLLVGIPAMIGETLLGRLGRKNPVDTLRLLAQKYRRSRRWTWLGWWGAFGLVLVLSFYSVVAGWTVAYAIKAVQGQFTRATPEHILRIWQSFLSSPQTMLAWHTFFMVITLWVVARGLKRGIEKASNLMMPTLFVILMVLMVHSCVTGDLKQALRFLFHFDVTQITKDVAIDALGLAFFTLAIGAGCILVYGAYLPKKTHIASSISIVAILDVLVALCASLAIFPIVFAYGLAPEGGPGLMFKVLPIAFSQMPGGAWIGGLFFVLLWFAAWTSTISIAEPLVLLVVEKTRLTRGYAAMAVGALCWTLGIAALLSFNEWQTLTVWRHTPFEWMTIVVNNVILPLGVFAFSWFVGWKIPKAVTQEELKPLSALGYRVWRFSVRYLIPAGVGLILISKLCSL